MRSHRWQRESRSIKFGPNLPKTRFWNLKQLLGRGDSSCVLEVSCGAGRKAWLCSCCSRWSISSSRRRSGWQKRNNCQILQKITTFSNRTLPYSHCALQSWVKLCVSVCISAATNKLTKQTPVTIIADNLSNWKYHFKMFETSQWKHLVYLWEVYVLKAELRVVQAQIEGVRAGLELSFHSELLWEAEQSRSVLAQRLKHGPWTVAFQELLARCNLHKLHLHPQKGIGIVDLKNLITSKTTSRI